MDLFILTRYITHYSIQINQIKFVLYLSPPGARKPSLEMLLLLVSILAGRLSLDSSNSSKPPSSDPNRKKLEKKTSDKKQGGQLGRVGKNLEPVEKPDEVVEIA